MIFGRRVHALGQPRCHFEVSVFMSVYAKVTGPSVFAGKF